MWRGFDAPALAPHVNQTEISIEHEHVTSFSMAFGECGFWFTLDAEPELVTDECGDVWIKEIWQGRELPALKRPRNKL